MDDFYRSCIVLSGHIILLFSIICAKLKAFKIKNMSEGNLLAFKMQKCDYSSRLFVPVAESITLEFKRLTYEALTSAVSQGAGTTPRIARLVVQIPEKTERTVGSKVERR